jgi:GMP synthase (glutamine-hydrolysing)
MPHANLLTRHDMMLLGGSGDYSAAGEGDWLERALDTLREIHRLGRPTFASCWGFQAMARALGGHVIHDPPRAELGTIELYLTPQGECDPVFGRLGRSFLGQAGHEDRVEQLPEGAVLLASSSKVVHQAYCFPDRPIYCTQFHPELNKEDLVRRVRAYPQYVRHIAGMTVERFVDGCHETPDSARLLRHFVEYVF